MNIYEVKINLLSSFSTNTMKMLIEKTLKYNGITFEKVDIQKKGELVKFEVMKETRGRKNKYPFREMKVGDEFIFSQEYSREKMRRAWSAGNCFASKSSDCKHYKFSVKKGNKNEVIITRIK